MRADYRINDAIMEARELSKYSPGLDDDYAHIIDRFLNHGFAIIGESARRLIKKQQTEVLHMWLPHGTNFATEAVQYLASVLECDITNVAYNEARSIDTFTLVTPQCHLPHLIIHLHTSDLPTATRNASKIDLDLLVIRKWGIQDPNTHGRMSIQQTLDMVARAAAWEYTPLVELDEDEEINLACEGFCKR